MMAEIKTKKTDESVEEFLERSTTGVRKGDCFIVLKMMKQVTRSKPRMWGSSIVGFGAYTYKYGSGQTADWPIIAFAPRKQDLTLYLMPGFASRASLLAKLGKHREGKGCVYLKSLGDVDQKVLKQLLTDSVDHMKARDLAAF